MTITYPHEIVIMRVSPFPNADPGRESKGVAGVTLGYGPIVIRAKLMRGSDQRLFLSMPARKKEASNDWIDHAYIQDNSLLREFERRAIAAYEDMMSNPGNFAPRQESRSHHPVSDF